jgi:hypothetical protein
MITCLIEEVIIKRNIYMAYRNGIRTEREIRNSPKPDDELELAYANEEADNAASKLIDKYSGEPEFLRRVLWSAVNKVMPAKSNKQNINDEENEGII